MNLDPLLFGPRRLTKSTGWVATAAYVVGGLLLVCSAYIHVRLWKSEGYRHIPTIGPLFIVQSIVGMVIGVAVVAVRRVWVAVLGAGFAVSTMAGFLLSVEVGLFGFQDTWSAPFAKEAFLIESSIDRRADRGRGALLIEASADGSNRLAAVRSSVSRVT